MNQSRRVQIRSRRRAVATRCGMILILVLVVIAMLSLAGYTFAELMFTERKATHIHGRERQLHAVVASGTELLGVLLEQPVQDEAGGTYDNPELFRHVLVLSDDDRHVHCHFTAAVPVTSTAAEEAVTMRFGVESDSARLNLRTLLSWDRNKEGAAREALLHLSGMTDETADAILDWIDADDDSREFGAESDYYSQLENGYRPRNAAPETIEELLLVRGVTRSLLFGTEHTGGQEMAFGETVQRRYESLGANSEASLRGWASYLTLYSAEANRTAEHKPRIYLNDDSLKHLYEQLVEVFDEERAHFVIAYRQFGPYAGAEQSTSGSVPLALNQPGKFKLQSVADLIDINVRVVHSDQSEPTILKSPFGSNRGEWRNELPRLFSLLSVTDKRIIFGRVDVNRASPEVLAGVPGIDETVLEDLLTKRSDQVSTEGAAGRDVSWLVSEEVVSLEKFKELEPFLTGGGDVYRSQITGYFDDRGPTLTKEVVIDASSSHSRLVRWRQLPRLSHQAVHEKFEIDPTYDSRR